MKRPTRLTTMSESPDLARSKGGEARALPILWAMALQLAALVMVYFSLHAVWRLAHFQIALPVAALLQGAVAALLSLRRLPSWWLPIQFLLPLGLVGAHALHLPSWIFLSIFLILLALYWTTFRTRVPYYPSGPAAWEKVAALLPAGSLRIIDIGSGFGGLAFFLASQRRDCQVVGVEVAPLPWAVSKLHAAWQGMRGEASPEFRRGDYRKLNLADYDVIFAYLSPAAMPSLWEQARRQMRPGCLLLSYEFEVPGQVPHLTIATPDGRQLYGWRM